MPRYLAPGAPEPAGSRPGRQHEARQHETPQHEARQHEARQHEAQPLPVAGAQPRRPAAARSPWPASPAIPVYARGSWAPVQRACECGCGGNCGESDELQLDGVAAPAGDRLEDEADQVAAELTGAAPAADRPATDDATTEQQPDYAVTADHDGAAVRDGAADHDGVADHDGTAVGEGTAVAAKAAGTAPRGSVPGGDVARQIRTARSGGDPLPPQVRDHFEPRFGADFGQVRVHADERADQLSRSLHAWAFTAGADIFFRRGQYRPDSQAGQSLLAHELTHVVQQQGTPAVSRSPVTVQRQPKPGKTGGPDDDADMIEFTVAVPADFTSIEQVFRLYERVAYGREMNHTWVCADGCVLANRRGKTVKFRVHRSEFAANIDPAAPERQKKQKQELAGKGAADKKALTDEADRRYSKLTGDKPGTKIPKGEEGKAHTWDNQLDDVMREGAKLDALPPAVKDLLTGKSKVFPPKDYQRLLQIADKLAKLSPEDLAAFKLLAVRATDNLDLFEKAVDTFIARKEELVKALKAQQQQSQQAPAAPDNLKAAFDEKWKSLDEKTVATMSESDRYDLARRMTAEMTEAQLKYMKDHPGETLKDFAKSATLLNTPETFKGIGKDLAEAANGDANSWARWAGGVGAGAKLSGWLLALAGIIYVASWLTGVGELATIGAAAMILLGSTITLSAAESELRIKAASQTSDPAEFKRQIEAAAAARANVIVSVAMIAIAAALHFVAKAAFPKTMQNLSKSLARFREQIRLKGSVHELKPSIASEMGSRRGELASACDTAKAQSVAQSKEIAKLSLDEFVDRLESGSGDFLDQTKVPPEQRVNYRELTKSPEGRSAIKEYQQRLVDSLANDVPTQIESLKNNYLGKIDEFLKDVDAAGTHEDLAAAIDKLEPTLAEESLKDFMKGQQDKLTAQKVADARAAMEQEAQRLQQQNAAKQAQQQPTQPTQQPTQPAPTQPAPTQPAPTQPAPTQPAPTQPAPTQPAPKPAPPAPTQPAPTQPAPTQPAPTQPKSGTPATDPNAKPTPADPTAKPATDPNAPTTDPNAKPTPADAATQAVKAELTSKIKTAEGEVSALRQTRTDLNARIRRVRAADEKVGQLDRDLKRASDADRPRLTAERDAALQERKAAADDLKAFREKNNISSDSELDFAISALDAELARLRDALNPKPSAGVDETKPLGGRYYDVPAQGGEVNHMPADSANPDLSQGKGPSIRMDIPDHYATNSWGSSKAAVAWRAKQAGLIAQGKFLDALAMDIADVRGRFGAKYEKGIQQMLDYVEKSPEIRALSKNSTVKVSDLRVPPKPAP
jgi:Domain of unknown function (DUF4157)